MSAFTKRLLWFQIYYIVQVVWSVVMNAYYIMLASKDREACIVQTAASSGAKLEDVSASLTRSFIAGFVLHMINLTINTFIEPCIRIVALDGTRRRPNEPRFSNWYMIGYASDITFRLAFVIFSIGQLILLGSDGVAKCGAKPELLYDSNWLRSLATIQVLFVPAFVLWRHFAVLDLKPDGEPGAPAPNSDHN